MMADDDIAIKVEGVSKKYCKSLKRSMAYGVHDIARNALGMGSNPGVLRNEEFWAVNDVSFEVRKGETLGIIGPNGSGKTTLLKMINGIFWPDKGKITVNGKVGALIAVGAGFHPSLTGRENIYVNAAILGMTKKEVDGKLDDIIDFAEIGDFLDVPVKFYSSGMFVRLGFSVAAHCEPDILLIDEVLAVGDISFQHKCLRHLKEIMSRSAVVFVNHNPDIIRFTCESVVYLENGITQFVGDADDGVNRYFDSMMRKSTSNNKANIISKYGSKVELLGVKFFDMSQKEVDEITIGDELSIECSFKAFKEIENAILGVAFYLNAYERSFICYSSQIGKYYRIVKGYHKFNVSLPNIQLCGGIYHLALIISEGNELAYHSWNSRAQLIVKNPNPQNGLYKMDFNFSLDARLGD
jgi:lipopolysaccharide transport system ATP-binding protein